METQPSSELATLHDRVLEIMLAREPATVLTMADDYHHRKQ
jgi:hypothetical protein